jgi:ketosteroid isomerase-like protein
MASTNLDLVRSIFTAWERGDFSSVEWAHPEHEYVIAGGPSPGTWTGLPAMAEAWREFLSAWHEWRTVAEEYRELDDERVLVLVHTSARGKTSGLEIRPAWTKGAVLFYVRGGKVTKHVVYLERGLALAELGLASDADSP